MMATGTSQTSSQGNVVPFPFYLLFSSVPLLYLPLLLLSPSALSVLVREREIKDNLRSSKNPELVEKRAASTMPFISSNRRPVLDQEGEDTKEKTKEEEGGRKVIPLNIISNDDEMADSAQDDVSNKLPQVPKLRFDGEGRGRKEEEEEEEGEWPWIVGKPSVFPSLHNSSLPSLRNTFIF
ncbi:hypothetical protein GUITHDRAFT_149928 [Guillardia theta CCMP2712]|uniref:Uncharacterized protein n=1 Tax=Guillardia theta (strain CCMP2712) TaxID=905079 RepID=L1K3Q7_GUITC|nr:hypothetical protein GUITHDRAFT_149928 [Guillardia theta CCMP2712]EKX54998.1 hypothetical protein GUITHDRAFT_149928 [Guillardia theta CCMP2712]|eukprot:XP_005841978.1 hypothetical protein GUITHDRAFT_149928 [Guillardia theta CCMP2712]